ncbi:MAG TPA: histidine kinase dimerization/phospho-acceptor domain-containing protein, partial [Anaerolineae bacterium]|nr:histidine kinase dimerization/phospho-acceptor domain-containing protein [Anaerolineae bacterium]
MDPPHYPESDAEHLSTLHAVGERVSAPSGLTELLGDTLDRVIELLRADAGAILVADEGARELVLASHRGISAAFAAKEARLPIGTCMCGHAVEAGEPLVLVDDAALEPRCVIGHCMEDGFRSLLCLPLSAGGRVWGLLRLHGRAPDAFDGREARLLSFIGSQLGLAIQRVRLQEEIARLLRRIEEEHAALDSLVRSLVDGLILVDGDGRVAYWNPSAERYLGLKAEAVLGRGPEAIDAHLHAIVQDAAQGAAALRRALADPAAYPQFEFRVTAPAPRTLQARFFPVQGRQGYGVVLRDVTGERYVDEMKTQLLATVSHELRTPLASIKGFASTLLRADVQWEPATQREFLQIIDQEADRLGELIGNLLAMSRLEAGVLRLDFGRVGLAGLIEETAAELRPRVAGHALSIDVPAGLPDVWADARRVRQVLHNLVENAIKYSSGGEIRIR